MALVEPTGALPPSPKEEARRLLAESAATKDPHDRCRLLGEAVTLDPTATAARFARAESRCAPAKVLLDDARALFAAEKDTRAATLLVVVGTRAESKADALVGAAALAALTDPSSLGLAAHTYLQFGEPARAMSCFDRLAASRAEKGAAVDALDARLEATILAARTGAKDARERLLAVIPEAQQAMTSYGAAWVRPRFIEAVGTLRAAGDELGAKTALAKADVPLGLALDPGRAVERAIAEARAGKPAAARLLAKKLRAGDLGRRAARALLAVLGRLDGQCGKARAHAVAHQRAAEDSLSLGDDVAWAASCEGTQEPTLTTPRPSALVEDALAVAPADPLRVRSLLEREVAARPGDVPARLAFVSLARPEDRPALLRAAPNLASETALVLALFDATAGAERAEAAKLLATGLLRTVEAGVDPRAAVPLLVRAMQASSTEDAWLDVADALVGACAGPPKASSCGAGELLGKATNLLRVARPAGACVAGLALSNVDLAPRRVRLDVALSCVTAKKMLPAAAITGDARGAFAGPEAALARSALAALQKSCGTAKLQLGAAAILAAEFPTEVAAIKARCP